MKPYAYVNLIVILCIQFYTLSDLCLHMMVMETKIYQMKNEKFTYKESSIYVQETFADIPDEFCDEDDSSVIGESIIQVILFNVLYNIQ